MDDGHLDIYYLPTGSEPSTSGPRVGAAPPQYPNTPPTPASKEPDLNIKLSSFVVPAPPVQSQPVQQQQQQQQQQSAGEKMRRHSDSEHFVSPRAPADVQQEAVALAELLLKRGGKVCIPPSMWLWIMDCFKYRFYVSFVAVLTDVCHVRSFEVLWWYVTHS